MKNIIAIFLLFFSLLACSEEKGVIETMKNIDCEAHVVVEEWLGKRLDQAINQFGTPLSEEIFDLNNSVVNEFRGKLRILFPDVVSEKWIKELSWVVENDCMMTLWLDKQQNDWVVVDAFYWNKDAEF